MNRINVGKERKAISKGSILILNEPLNLQVTVEEILSSTMLSVSYYFESEIIFGQIHISQILKIEE